MDRKKKPNGLLISGLISALASLAIVAVAPGLAHHKTDHQEGGEQTASESGSENTPGNDRKEGYEDNSTEPQETNHGQGSDNDGDADSDSETSYTEDNDTNDGGTANNVEDDGDNEHPSGKDRSVESGGSGTQGKAESNPDDSNGPMRYEGVQGDDKPNGPGGTDLADQDGNNGCGNDDDFDDDNNGWCGKPATCPDGSRMPADGTCDDVAGEVITQPSQPTCPDGSIMPAGGNCGENVPCPEGTVMDANGNCLEVNPSVPEQVLGEQVSKDKAEPEAPSVLGVKLSPALSEPVEVAGAVLPFTGGDVLLFLVLALALFASGMLIMRSTRRGTTEN
ncbi:MAG: hypothetical protein M3N53_08480 [Actinomycetota bacterium]|nr:hypothetical protein [Actinomycetota bacterium]